MKRKLLFCTMLVIAIMSSCRKKYDVMGVITPSMDNNIVGTYSWIAVDTVNLQSTIMEYALLKEGQGNFSYFKSGNAIPQEFSEMPLTWSRGGFIDHNAYISMSINLQNGVVKNPKWSSLTLFFGDSLFVKSNKISSTKSIYSDFSNTNWERSDSVVFQDIQVQMVKYLEWNQAKGNDSYLTTEEIAAKKEYFAQPWVRDTIRWFNETYQKKVPDTIKVTTAKKGDKFLCVFYIGTEKVEQRLVPTYLADAKTTTSQFHFDLDDLIHSGVYYYHYFEQDSAHYLNPTAPQANAVDSLFQFNITGWCVGSLVSSMSFDIIARGNLTWTYWKTTKGVKEDVFDRSVADTTLIFSLTQVYKGDEATLNGLKHHFVK
ncbi:MAG: hypothetical protein MJZ64_03565 [Paludibacteraceae bacterium]|nr:hypothetical protein [Paludibacteraceae bacterium]